MQRYEILYKYATIKCDAYINFCILLNTLYKSPITNDIVMAQIGHRYDTVVAKWSRSVQPAFSSL
jgi:hypothetical protein